MGIHLSLNFAVNASFSLAMIRLRARGGERLGIESRSSRSGVILTPLLMGGETLLGLGSVSGLGLGSGSELELESGSGLGEGLRVRVR